MGSGASRQSHKAKDVPYQVPCVTRQLSVSTRENDLGCPSHLDSRLALKNIQSGHSSCDTSLSNTENVTPRREINMRTSIPQTPYGEQVAQYPYYCPLCMEHFKDILVSPCCGNYTCIQCCIDYLDMQGITSESASINEVLERLQRMTGRSVSSQATVGSRQTSTNQKVLPKSIHCPQCMQNGFLPHKVKLGSNAAIRSYVTTPLRVSFNESPTTKTDLDESENSADNLYAKESCYSTRFGSPSIDGIPSKSHVPPVLSAAPIHSPVKIGDSFEDLKRKMKRFSYESKCDQVAKPGSSSSCNADSSAKEEPEAQIMLLSSPRVPIRDSRSSSPVKGSGANLQSNNQNDNDADYCEVLNETNGDDPERGMSAATFPSDHRQLCHRTIDNCILNLCSISDQDVECPESTESSNHSMSEQVTHPYIASFVLQCIEFAMKQNTTDISDICTRSHADDSMDDDRLEYRHTTSISMVSPCKRVEQRMFALVTSDNPQNLSEVDRIRSPKSSVRGFVTECIAAALAANAQAVC